MDGKLVVEPGIEVRWLTVIKQINMPHGGYNRKGWLCKCICGNLVEAIHGGLVRGLYASCGCKRFKYPKPVRETPEYKVWLGMKYRCLNPKAPNYVNYGGRGITVCQEWIESFQAFYDHIGPRPSDKHSIDRIDNEGNYEPGNVRWALSVQQQRNLRSNTLYEINGVTKCLSEWAEQYGISYDTFLQRVTKFNWDVVKALTTPIRPKKPDRTDAKYFKKLARMAESQV